MDDARRRKGSRYAAKFTYLRVCYKVVAAMRHAHQNLEFKKRLTEPLLLLHSRSVKSIV